MSRAADAIFGLERDGAIGRPVGQLLTAGPTIQPSLLGLLHEIALDEVHAGGPQRGRALRVLHVWRDHAAPALVRELAPLRLDVFLDTLCAQLGTEPLPASPCRTPTS